MMCVRELATRLVPWDRVEMVWCHNRPHHERPPLPGPGDKVWLRRHNWDHDVDGNHVPTELATVLAAQDLGDREDPNLWQVVRDHLGQPIYDAGTPRLAPVPDPWPRLTVRVDRTGEHIGCREARLRGSAGWLPLDHATRPERWRLPAETALVARPPLAPLNV